MERGTKTGIQNLVTPIFEDHLPRTIFIPGSVIHIRRRAMSWSLVTFPWIPGGGAKSIGK